MHELDFDIIRPYNDNEIQEAIPRIISDDTFHLMMDYLFTSDKKELILADLVNVSNITEFQRVFSLPVVQSIVNKTSEGVTYSGFENLNKENSYLYIANHRDIVLDSSILAETHLKVGFKTHQATWGSNLMVSPLIVDLGKANQMITVFREGSPKELLLNSKRLSAYLRKSITELNKSVWIAQRKGRAKNGFDKTDVSILKMLTLSGNKDIKSKLLELNITPVAISYEWEPCDAMKVREVYLSRDHNYVKAEDEDFKSILGGLISNKGRIHVSMGTPINNEILEIDNSNINNNGFVGKIAELIDIQIYTNYKLWPSNYLAYDLLNNTAIFSKNYNNNTKTILEERYDNTAKVTHQDNNDIRELFLLLYANPVINRLKIVS